MLNKSCLLCKVMSVCVWCSWVLHLLLLYFCLFLVCIVILLQFMVKWSSVSGYQAPCDQLQSTEVWIASYCLAVDNADASFVRLQCKLSIITLHYLDTCSTGRLLLLVVGDAVRRSTVGCAVAATNWQTRRTHMHAHVAVTSHVSQWRHRAHRSTVKHAPWIFCEAKQVQSRRRKE